MKVYASEKTLKLIGAFCAVLLVVVLMIAGTELISERSFVRTKGTVIATNRVVDLGINNGTRTTVMKTYTCEYQSDGVKHECTFRTLLPVLHRKGSSTVIAYDPVQPSIVRDKFKMECCVLIGAFFCIFQIFIIKAIGVVRQEQ